MAREDKKRSREITTAGPDQQSLIRKVLFILRDRGIPQPPESELESEVDEQEQSNPKPKNPGLKIKSGY